MFRNMTVFLPDFIAHLIPVSAFSQGDLLLLELAEKSNGIYSFRQGHIGNPLS